jgi:hypothetical protein
VAGVAELLKACRDWQRFIECERRVRAYERTFDSWVAPSFLDKLPDVLNFTCASIANFIPAGFYDLLVFSEIGYYFDESVLPGLAQRPVDRLTKNGTLIAVHCLGVSEDHVLSGHRVHTILSALLALRYQHGELHPHFQLDRWRRL